MKTTPLTRTLLILLAAAILLLPFLAAAEPATKEIRKEWPARAGLVVQLENLAGKVTLEGNGGGRCRARRDAPCREGGRPRPPVDRGVRERGSDRGAQRSTRSRSTTSSGTGTETTP